MTRLRFLAVLAALLPAACMQYTAIGPGRTTVDGGVSIEPSIAWNRASGTTTGASTETWTLDGQLLDTVTILGGVADGAPLALLRGVSVEKLAPFRSTMTPNEIMDLYEASWSSLAKTSVTRTSNLRPAKLGGVDGFRFDASYTGVNEVASDVAAVGAVRNGKLYLIIYRGTHLHYFPTHLPDFERLVESVRLPGA
jgi:hypothetical protein